MLSKSMVAVILLSLVLCLSSITMVAAKDGITTAWDSLVPVPSWLKFSNPPRNASPPAITSDQAIDAANRDYPAAAEYAQNTSVRYCRMKRQTGKTTYDTQLVYVVNFDGVFDSSEGSSSTGPTLARLTVIVDPQTGKCEWAATFGYKIIIDQELLLKYFQYLHLKFDSVS